VYNVDIELLIAFYFNFYGTLMIQEGYNNIIESELNDAVDFAVASKKRKSITFQGDAL
jgi:hypothetical protein